MGCQVRIKAKFYFLPSRSNSSNNKMGNGHQWLSVNLFFLPSVGGRGGVIAQWNSNFRITSSYFYPKQSCIYQEIGAFIKNCIWLWCSFCFLNFLFNSHSSPKIYSFQPVQRYITSLEILGHLITTKESISETCKRGQKRKTTHTDTHSLTTFSEM